MKVRCGGSAKDAPYYRGVKICQRWLNSFENFLEDMGPRPLGMTLDRKNNKGNYTIKNCRWATQEEQGQNKTAWVQFKINLQDAREIRRLSHSLTRKEIAKKFGLSECYTGLVIRGFYWREK